MEKLKEIEREKRVNDAQRNVRLAECRVELLMQKVSQIEQGEDMEDVHVIAKHGFAKIELKQAERDLREAKEAVIAAEADPDELDKIMKILPL